MLTIRYYWCVRATLDDIPVVISRTGWTGEIGYEIYLCHPERRDELWDRVGGERVGHVSATTWSPRLDENIGYVWVPVALAPPGTALEVGSPLGHIGGVTASLPFVDPGKRMPKS